MLKRALLTTSTFAVFIAAFHTYLIYSSHGDHPHWEYLWAYPLLLVLTLGIFLVVNYVRGVDRHKAGMAYLVGSTLKMFISLGYLIPNIMGRGEDGYPFVMNFIVPYFLLLACELFWTLRLIRQK